MTKKIKVKNHGIVISKDYDYGFCFYQDNHKHDDITNLKEVKETLDGEIVFKETDIKKFIKMMRDSYPRPKRGSLSDFNWVTNYVLDRFENEIMGIKNKTFYQWLKTEKEFSGATQASPSARELNIYKNSFQSIWGKLWREIDNGRTK